MAQSANAFFDQLEKDCLNHPALTHSYLDKLNKGKADRGAIKILAEQYYCFSMHFSRYLAAAVAACPNEAARAPLIKNLFEEYGGRSEENKGMDAELTHPAIFRMFLKAAGVDTTPSGLEAIKALPETKLFVEKYLNLGNMHYVAALGALGPGTEYIVPTMYTPMREGCRKAGFSEDDVLFFSAHIELDVEHGANIRTSLMPFADTDENQRLMREGAMDVLDARVVLWNGLERASGL